MSEKRFVDGGEECVEDQFLIDTLTDEYYFIDKGLDDIVKLLNNLYEENEQLKKALRVAYNETKLTEQTKSTIEKIAELSRIDFK